MSEELKERLLSQMKSLEVDIDDESVPMEIRFQMVKDFFDELRYALS